MALTEPGKYGSKITGKNKIKDDRMNLQELQNQLRQKEKELFSIQKIGQALSNTLKLDDLLNLIMKETTELMDADRSTLYLVDHKKKEIWSKIALKAEVKEIRQKFGMGISGYVAASGKTVNIPDAYQDSRFDPSTDKRTGYRTRSILCMPVWEPLSGEGERRLMGVIQVLNKKEGVFTEEDEGILAAICSQVAVAISNARLYQQLEKKYREIDLLYEFEQMLSEGHDVLEVFRNFLKRTLRHLQGEFAAVIFPLDGVYHILLVGTEGRLEHQVLRHLKDKPLDILKKKQVVKENDTQELLRDYFPMFTRFPLENVKIMPVTLDAEKELPAAIFFQAKEEVNLSIEEEDEQLLEIVGQKVARTLELHDLRQSLLQKERLSAVGQMMSTIVHDLRSPLNNINGFMELLLEERTTPEEKAEFAEIIQVEIQTINNMTTEILDFAKGKTSILPRKCAAKDILNRFKPQLEQLFRQTDIELQIRTKSHNLLYADVEKITRVLYNIAKNAREAMGNSGSFIFSVFDERDKVVFELTDTGPGIPEEIRDRLFETFVTSGKKSGTGLGLAIVKKIVDDHHGEITIQSETGKGTTFRIELPVYKKGNEPDA